MIGTSDGSGRALNVGLGLGGSGLEPFPQGRASKCLGVFFKKKSHILRALQSPRAFDHWPGPGQA